VHPLSRTAVATAIGVVKSSARAGRGACGHDRPGKETPVKHILAALCALILLAPVTAVATPPTEASLHELLTVVELHRLLDGLWGQLETMNRAAADQMRAADSLTPEQRRIVDDMQARSLGLVREELSWEVFEPMMIDIYGRTFSQAEVDGMLAFYRSDVGKAVIAKMPLAMQNAMQAVQSHVGPLREKLRQLQREAAEQLKASGPAP
jgi:uncharacterized protein